MAFPVATNLTVTFIYMCAHPWKKKREMPHPFTWNGYKKCKGENKQNRRLTKQIEHWFIHNRCNNQRDQRFPGTFLMLFFNVLIGNCDPTKRFAYSSVSQTLHECKHPQHPLPSLSSINIIRCLTSKGNLLLLWNWCLKNGWEHSHCYHCLSF